MANTPKKVKDPTEVALSAIQEALNISDTSVASNRNAIGSELAPSTIPSSAPSYSDTAFDTRSSADRPAFESIDEPRGQRRAANDDRETIGQILQAIQKGRPARSVYTLATIFGGVLSQAPVIRTTAVEDASRGIVRPYHCSEALSTDSVN